jgi:hypothetical protein
MFTGVPAIPLLSFGYRHFTERPLYFFGGRLYNVPPSESEYTLFMVEPDIGDNEQIPNHPRGGHNYYNGRDMEKFSRRMKWMDEMMGGKDDWERGYKQRLAKHEKTL